MVKNRPIHEAIPLKALIKNCADKVVHIEIPLENLLKLPVFQFSASVCGTVKRCMYCTATPVGAFDTPVGAFDTHVGAFDTHVGAFDTHVGAIDTHAGAIYRQLLWRVGLKWTSLLWKVLRN